MQLLFILSVPHWQRRGRHQLCNNILNSTTIVIILTAFLIHLCDGAKGEAVDKKTTNLLKPKTVLPQLHQDTIQEKLSIGVDASQTSNVVKSITSVFRMVREAIAQLRTESSTSRTFFLFPIVATMAPMFLAQMSGVALSILPVTTLLILPALLVPLGVTMFVYWV
ncbi:unnamed protein product [Orchesella dallaii]|uniref:Uncharacterized protein n=1 Tax=Orchesella dallaii TaxID=48710 RepID=A0ABP1PM79_9HEXA